MSEQTLKPCPFCGSIDTFEDYEYGYIACKRCGTCGPGALDVMNVDVTWNTRAVDADLPPGVVANVAALIGEKNALAARVAELEAILRSLVEARKETTPGPWNVLHKFNVMGKGTRRVVASCGGHSSNVEDVEQQNTANANFILVASVAADKAAVLLGGAQ